jgi:hypothetical protein
MWRHRQPAGLGHGAILREVRIVVSRIGLIFGSSKSEARPGTYRAHSYSVALIQTFSFTDTQLARQILRIDTFWGYFCCKASIWKTLCLCLT